VGRRRSEGSAGRDGGAPGDRAGSSSLAALTHLSLPGDSKGPLLHRGAPDLGMVLLAGGQKSKGPLLSLGPRATRGAARPAGVKVPCSRGPGFMRTELTSPAPKRHLGTRAVLAVDPRRNPGRGAEAVGPQ